MGDNYFGMTQKPIVPVHVIDIINRKRRNTWHAWALDQYLAVQLEIFSDGERLGKLGKVCKVVEVRSPHA